MTKPERRHFKSYAKSGSNGQQPKYLSLFDVLSKASSYDEKKITKKGYTYDDKNLLMEKILEALHVFHPRKSVDAEIQMLLNQAAILYDKNIWDEMDKRLQKARKLAIENERLLLLLQIIKMQTYLVAVLQIHGNSLEEEQIEVKEKLFQQINYDYIFYQITLVYNEDRTLAKPESREHIRQLSSLPNLPDLSDSSSVIAQINYHVIKYQYNLTLNDENGCVSHALQIVQLVAENDFTFTARPHSTTYLYFFFILYLEKANRPFRKDLNIVETIENIPVNSHYDLCFAYGFSLEYCILKLNKIQGEQLILKMDTNGYVFKNQLNQNQLLIFYQIMIFYGTFEEWEKAQIWLNKIVFIKRLGIRKNTKFKARLYSLIIYYELGINDFKTHLQSVQKYLQRNNKYTEVEKEIIQHIANVQEVIREKEKVVIWKKLHYFLEEASTPLNNIHIPTAQLQQWCKSKIEGIKIAEVIRRERMQS